jgi:predicted RND superfamily exporter protein
MTLTNSPSLVALTDFWVRYRWVFLAAGIVLLLAFWLFTPSIPASFYISELLSPNHPERRNWERLRQIFGDDEIIIVVYRDPDLFRLDGAGLARLRFITQELRTIPGVRDVWDIAQPLGDLILQPNLPVSRSVRALFQGYTHNPNGNLCAIVVLIDPSADSGEELAMTITRVQEVVAKRANGFMLGPIVLIQETLQQGERDSRQLLWLVAGLLTLVILFISRQIRWVITNLMIVGFAILATQATVVLANVSSGFTTAPLSAMITVVGVATLMHIQIRYQSYRDLGSSRVTSFITTIRQLCKPISLALITDCVGFGALSFSDIEPLREFALMAVAAVAWLAFSMIFFLPALILTGCDNRVMRRANHGNDLGVIFPQSRMKPISRGLLKILVVGSRSPIPVILGVVTLIVFSLSGYLQLEVETDFTRHFRGKNRLVTAYELVEHELGGAGVWDIAVPAPKEINRSYLTAILHLERRLRREVIVFDQPEGRKALTKVLSLADAVDSLRQYDLLGGAAQDFMDMIAVGTIQQRMPGLYRALYAPDPVDPDRWWLRIMLRSLERQSARSRNETIQQVRRIVDEEWPSIAATFRTDKGNEITTKQNPSDIANAPFVSGYFVLFGIVAESLLQAQNITFLVALVGMAFVFWIAFWDAWRVAALLFCNVLPIFSILGILGWCRIHVNLGVAMMAAVALGLCVDSSLHYITTYERLLRTRIGPTRSILRCQMMIGPPVVYATLALSVGFLSLIVSPLMPTVLLGLLLGLTMVAGLVTNVTLLPWLLLVMHRKNGGRVGTSAPVTSSRNTNYRADEESPEGDIRGTEPRGGTSCG